MNRITAEVFQNAFAEEWTNEISKNREKIISSFQSNKTLSAFMLIKEEGFLIKVMDNLNRTYSDICTLTTLTERYKIDVMYVRGPNWFGSEYMWYPHEVHVLIEHEQGEYPEEEIWKLAHWRAPLKVLIFYDFNGDQKKKDTGKENWLPRKLERMKKILDSHDTFWKENELTEYLLIVGNCEVKGSIPVWRTTRKNGSESISKTPVPIQDTK